MTDLRRIGAAVTGCLAAIALASVPMDAGTATAGHDRTARAKPALREYVSLGDSWSADVVLADGHGTPDTTHTPIDCAQSHTNYPKLVAAELGIPLHRDATCGSATTDDFYAPQDLPAGGQNPPQLDRLSRRTDLVTVGIGGNDAGIAGAGMDCLNALPFANPLPPGTVPPLPDNPVPVIGSEVPLGGCKEKYSGDGVDRLSQRIAESEPKLVRAFRRIHQLAPRARILAVDYLALVPDHGCYPTVPATDEDMAYIHAKFLELNAMVRRAARRGGAEFVNTFTPDHRPRPLPAPAHPVRRDLRPVGQRPRRRRARPPQRRRRPRPGGRGPRLPGATPPPWLRAAPTPEPRNP